MVARLLNIAILFHHFFSGLSNLQIEKCGQNIPNCNISLHATANVHVIILFFFRFLVLDQNFMAIPIPVLFVKTLTDGSNFYHSNVD